MIIDQSGEGYLIDGSSHPPTHPPADLKHLGAPGLRDSRHRSQGQPLDLHGYASETQVATEKNAIEVSRWSPGRTM